MIHTSVIIGIITIICILLIWPPKTQIGGSGDDCSCNNPYSEEGIKTMVSKRLPPHTLALVGVKVKVKDGDGDRDGDGDGDGARDGAGELASKLIPTGVRQKDIAPASTISTTTSTTLTTHTATLCKALEKTGFNPEWTLTDIESLQRTANGRKTLITINSMVKKLTGIKHITNRDIMSCYPNFYNAYICKREAPASPPLDGIIATATATAGPKPKAKIRSKPKAKLSNLSKLSKLSNPSNPSKLSKHCNRKNIRKDLSMSIAAHLGADLSQPSDSKYKAQMTADYLELRADLEIRNIINLFQDKTKKEWLIYLSGKKDAELRGYHLQGTTYYIPWYIFDKYKICFGMTK
jgi:hypothetical protein